MNFELTPVVVIEQLDIARLTDGISLKLTDSVDLYETQTLKSAVCDGLWTCGDCGQQFGRQTSLKTHMKLNTGECLKCEHCGKLFGESSALNVHLASHSVDKPFQCEYCDKSFRHQYYLNNHRKSIHREFTSVACDDCGTICKDQRHFERHVRKHTRKALHTCRHCGIWFSQLTLLQKHEAKHAVELSRNMTKPNTDRKWKCKVCGKDELYEAKLIVHMRVHTGEKPYECQFCAKTFSQLTAKRLHEVRWHGAQKPKKCPHCKLHFFDPKRLQVHVLHSHGGERPFKCQYCDLCFKRNEHVNLHEMRHRGEKNHACTLCVKSFVTSGDLRVHLRVHTREKPYSCRYCVKTFTQRTHLNTHEKIHVGDRKFCCNVCSKKFIEKGSLQVHLRIHTNEKPYKCDLCHKCFVASSALTLHRRTHSEDKPYSCSECNKCFTNSQGLLHHVMQHHTGEKPYSCHICDKQYIMLCQLSEHLARHAGLTYPCRFCTRVFSSKSGRMLHERSHVGNGKIVYLRCTDCLETFRSYEVRRMHRLRAHGKGPFVTCETCGQHFINNKTLRHHALKHSAEKLVCCVCNKLFQHPSSLTRHLRFIHDGRAKAYGCGCCGKTFRDKYAAEKHFRRCSMTSLAHPHPVAELDPE